MAIVKCSECSREVSDKAKACPSCGAPVKARKSRSRVLFLLVLAGVVIAAVGSMAEQGKRVAAAPVAPDEQRKRDARNQQQSAAITVVQTMRRNAKDPESFELKELTVGPDGSACYTYRARNSFNAMLQSSAVLVAGARPQLLREEADGNRFVAAWNKICTKAGGEDITALAQRLLKD